MLSIHWLIREGGSRGRRSGPAVESGHPSNGGNSRGLLIALRLEGGASARNFGKPPASDGLDRTMNGTA
eukprot:753895-Hanusia_phi.AAC.6